MAGHAAEEKGLRVIRYKPDRDEKIAALTSRYAAGEFSETVFLTSLLVENVNIDDVHYLIDMHQSEHRNSLPYRRAMRGNDA